MPSSAVPPIELPHLATFHTRGVAAPFTASMLAGVRVRAARANGIELVLPNPSGEPGVYVLDQAGVRQMCNPTVHDTLLLRRLGSLGAIDPASVRDAALQVALKGYAGREAMAAAEAALEADRRERAQAQCWLLTRLIQRAAPTDPGTALTTGRDPELERRASAILRRIAPALGRPAADLAAGLIALGDALGPVGVAAHDTQARLPRLIIRLEDTGAELSHWLAADVDDAIGGLGQAVAAAMGTAARIGSALLGATRTLAGDPVALLRLWVRDAASTVELLRRCDWLLDGWERACLLWAAAGTHPSRLAAVLEIAQLVPDLPSEVTTWRDVCVPPEAFGQTCRVTSQQDGWRIGAAAFALTERNEKLRAMSQ